MQASNWIKSTKIKPNEWNNVSNFAVIVFIQTNKLFGKTVCFWHLVRQNRFCLALCNVLCKWNVIQTDIISTNTHCNSVVSHAPCYNAHAYIVSIFCSVSIPLYMYIHIIGFFVYRFFCRWKCFGDYDKLLIHKSIFSGVHCYGIPTSGLSGIVFCFLPVLSVFNSFNTLNYNSTKGSSFRIEIHNNHPTSTRFNKLS